MKILQEIRDEYAHELGFQDWEDLKYDEDFILSSRDIDNIAKTYAREVAKEALKNAATNLNKEWRKSIDTSDAPGYILMTVIEDKNIPI